MSKCFSSGWMTCLDKYMSPWMSQFTCPGFMFVPRKPWPFGNEWHTIACGHSNVLFQVELVKGKDFPKEQPMPEFNELGKTVGLLLCLTKPLWGTGKIVILDSGFCVLQGLLSFVKHGVFAAALIKKQKYWPKYIRRDEIQQDFSSLSVGTCDAWRGSLDGVDFHDFCMKEPTYVMMLMSTYGTLHPMGHIKH
eukprot:CAMPEP_0118690650 /NCGR_PEP_ID=MMETSP0800-20121206/10236_1 /TAXON_ID=210618 ORGANISM="Striatella unipunctata, Strain CCMP2910" /NCGR_SAMPLE_ID=MMETSP0800 /ASSEMBLY_ACC=CAM_ASM_000638 /LENGTH=192 /DNA_ID=CAMNT_0006588329 /DNA_START=370 /DNA_END=947 /DNA_ORIENTATION=-